MKKVIKPTKRKIYPGDLFVRKTSNINYISLVPFSDIREEIFLVLETCHQRNWCTLYNVTRGETQGDHISRINIQYFSNGEITFLWSKQKP